MAVPCTPPQLREYSFTRNYFSDLGRSKTFRGQPNNPSQQIFTFSLVFSGVSTLFYFLALPGLFRSKPIILVASLFGIIAGISYIGIALIPWNLNYWGHVNCVRTGFVAFLIMSILYAMAIFQEEGFPNKYAIALALFAIILGMQILIMFYGPRAYRSDEGLFIQVIAQKVVVYAEIFVILYTSIGALKHGVKKAKKKKP